MHLYNVFFLIRKRAYLTLANDLYKLHRHPYYYQNFFKHVLFEKNLFISLFFFAVLYVDMWIHIT